MNIHLFSFIRDEAYLLRRWIPYHASIMGLSNIHIIDHKSTDKECITLLQRYKKEGLDVIKTERSFDTKYKQLTKLMHKYASRADILIALDADEFLCLSDEDHSIRADLAAIRAQLQSLPVNGKKYAFHVYEAVLDQIDYNDPLIEMTTFEYFKASEKADGPNQQTKTFFPAKNFSYTDQGNHKGGILLAPNDEYNISKMAIAHFHMLGYRHFQQKLQKAVDAYNLQDLPPDYVGTGMRWNEWYHQTKSLSDEEKTNWFRSKFMKRTKVKSQPAFAQQFALLQI